MKKIISLSLVLVMLLTSLASCKNEGGAVKETQAADTSVKSDDPISAEADERVEELAAEYDFAGKTFAWIGSGAVSPTEEEEIGDVQSDALYYRQRDIEDKFGVDWVNYCPESDESGTSGAVLAITEDVMAGTGAFSAGYGMQWSVIQPLLVNDMLLDLTDFDTIDYERPWWPETLRESYTIGDSMYLLNGPIVSFHYQDAASIVFNKTLATDYAVADPYEIVKSGEWTYDKMFELASNVPENRNGTSVYRYCNPEAVGIILSCGYTVTQFDETGKPYVESSLTKEISDLADKFAVVFGDDSQTAHVKRYSVGQHESWEDKYDYKGYSALFADNQALFMFIPTDEAAWLRIEEVEFGILPMPKLTAEQEDYISYADRASTHDVFVPKSAKDREMIDVILEVMAALGYKYFKPVYYDNILKSRATYDTESQEMVDIIFNGKKYDIITLLDNTGSYVGLLNHAIVESNEGISSKFKMQGRIINNNISALIASIGN